MYAKQIISSITVFIYVLVFPAIIFAQTAPTISINPATTYQTITGWEATGFSGEIRPSFPLYSDALFDQVVNDLGITRIRLELRGGVENSTDHWTNWKNAGFPSTGTAYSTWRCNRAQTVNDNSDPNVLNPSGFQWSELDNTIDKVILPLRQRMQAKGENLFINLNYVAFTGQNTCGGTYIHNIPAEYAEMVLATYQHMQSKYGFVPDSWEVILEPDNNTGWANGTLIGQTIKAAGDKLAANGYPGVKFIAPSTACIDRAAYNYIGPMIAVPGALQYISEFSYHRYCGASAQALGAIAKYATDNNKNTSHLEHIGANYHELHEDLTTGRNSAWAQYTIGGPCSSCTDSGGEYYYMDITDPNNPQIKMGSRTKFLRQYFKFIRPGALRIEASSTNANFNPVAFTNSDGKQVVVIKALAGGTFSVGNLPAGTYGIKFTTDTQYNIDNPDQNIITGQNITTNIPAAGVITIYDKSANASPLPSAVKLGDLDVDNDVDIFDYNILLTDFGKTGTSPADIDKNGKVDIFDYNTLLTNFGK